MVTTHNIYLCI